MTEQKKKMKLWVKLVLTAVCILAAGLAAVSIIIYSELSKITELTPGPIVPPEQEYFETDNSPPDTSAPLSEAADNPAQPLNPNDVLWPGNTEITNREGIINILLIGQDRRSGQGRQRSDCMILVSYNTATGAVKLISLMRDLYVPISGYSDNRLNTAYAFGGMELLDETIEKNFGVKINGNVEVDFERFTSVIDAMGGIDIPLSADEANYLNRTEGWSLSPGLNHLNGSQALSYSRIRYIDSDYQRTERQRTVISKLLDQILAMSNFEKVKLVDMLLPYLATDLPKSDILSYVFTVAQSGMSSVEQMRIPADGTYTPAMIREMSVLVPDLSENRRLLHAFIFGD